MNTTSARKPNGRTHALAVLAGTFLFILLALAPGRAYAAYTAEIETGTLVISGDAAGDVLVLRFQPGAPGPLEVDVAGDGSADFTFDRTTFTAIDVNAGGGDDEVRIVQIGGSVLDELVTMNGGPGADTLVGGSGPQTLLGGGGDDVVVGGDGDDQADLGGGDDRFVWNPGDDNDTVDGDGGDDLLDFNGANIGENVDVSANGARVRFTRNIANIVMDVDVERIGFRALGGADTIVVNDLAGTNAKSVDVDLDAIGGGGDGQPDSVTAMGTSGVDEVEFGNADGRLVVEGLAAQTRVTGGEETFDNLNVATLGDADAITMSVGVGGSTPVNIDGGDGDDTATYRGSAVDDEIAVVANGPEAATVAAATARFDTLAVESLTVLGRAGADTITGTGNLAPLTALTMDGGDGADIVRGGNGADTLIGGAGDDQVDGNQGADRGVMGSGDDRFQWDPGDGSDTVEGQGGSDALDFNGSAGSENIDVSANGDRGRLTRNLGLVTMDVDGIEHVNIKALGGTDAVVVNDLAGTDIDTVDVDLDAVGGVGDGQPDTVTAMGTEGADKVKLANADARVVVDGLAAETRVSGSEAALDNVNVAALGGADTVAMQVGVTGQVTINVDGGDGEDSATYTGTPAGDLIQIAANGAEVTTVAAGTAQFDTTVESLTVLGKDGADTIVSVGNLAALTALTIDGGNDADVLAGGNGADTIIGGDGDDQVDGNQGADRALLGKGEDRFQWGPGDGSDTVEGQAGIDQLDFNGSAGAEAIDVSANSGRGRLTRNLGLVTMDFDGIEQVNIKALGSVDTITVNDLAGTGIDAVAIDLAAIDGAGDTQADTVVVNGTNKKDSVQVTRSGSEVRTSGLAAQTRIVGSETIDTLRIQTLDGKDTVAVAPDVSALITPVVDLGPGQ